MSDHQQITTALDRLRRAGASVPASELGRTTKIIALFCVHDCMEKVLRDQNQNPYPLVLETLETQTRFLEQIGTLGSWIGKQSTLQAQGTQRGNVKRLTGLYEQAWTVYSRSTYEHSVDLILERLQANGFDEQYFTGKTCFDGGCGTARFAVAMAKLGAKKVIAADIGAESLAFAEHMLRDLGISTVELVNQDITDLSRWGEGTFDFTVSNGVLHHTIEQERGIREHFRVTKPGGTLWLYLYGAGGFYWEVYEAFRPLVEGIDAKDIRSTLLALQIRDGGVYSFLDMLAPIRTYYSVADIRRILQGQGTYALSNLKGSSEVDDTDRVLKTRYGAEILGPDGEIRLRIDKM